MLYLQPTLLLHIPPSIFPSSPLCCLFSFFPSFTDTIAAALHPPDNDTKFNFSPSCLPNGWMGVGVVGGSGGVEALTFLCRQSPRYSCSHLRSSHWGLQMRWLVQCGQVSPEVKEIHWNCCIISVSVSSSASVHSSSKTLQCSQSRSVVPHLLQSSISSQTSLLSFTL